MARLRQLRAAKGLTQGDLARIAHVGQSTISNWESGRTEPDYDSLREISRYFNVSADYLIGSGVFKNWDEILANKGSVYSVLRSKIPNDFVMIGAESFLISDLMIWFFYDFDEIKLAEWFHFAVAQVKSFSNGNEWQYDDIKIVFTSEFSAILSNHCKRTTGIEATLVSFDDMAKEKWGSVRIPVLGAIPAGIPIEAIQDIADWEEIPVELTRGNREYFGLLVEGDSMYPKYLSGDTVIVRKQSVCENGDDCVVYVNGFDATLKTVRLHDDGSLTTEPINPTYAPRTYTLEEIKTLPVSIAGIVVELRRKVKK